MMSVPGGDVLGSKMTPKNWVLEGNNWKLGEDGWVKID